MGHAIWPLRVPAGHGGATFGRVESESQAGGEAVEPGGAESPVQTAEKKETVAQ